MRVIQMLADMLPAETKHLLLKNEPNLTELRLRIHRPVQLALRNGEKIAGDVITPEIMSFMLNRLMQNSLYACEEELKQGYFTSFGGCRVGVCGHIHAGKQGVDSISGIGSLCIRIPREIRGCADVLADCFRKNGMCSMLILSPPGMGKTTMLRDLVRILSDSGRNVAVVDERREIAACMDAAAQLDVGANTDVMDGLKKSLAIPMLVRACKPEIIAVDELGGTEDACAVLDAVYSGVSVIATAHACGIKEAGFRQSTSILLEKKIFHFCAVLGDRPGQIKSLRAYANERLQNVQGDFTDRDISSLHGGRQIHFKCTASQI